jgi:alkanesulfonate monooxygenase SsuD/methylene tetrahydromethanopterin reductase-like flavin-dependent oxidoreductase (luciferase family)
MTETPTTPPITASHAGESLPRFSVFVPQMRMSFPAIIERARAAEAAGFDGISLMDHLAPPGLTSGDMYDVFVTASAIALATERLQICPLVLCASMRHPAVLAKQVVSLDHLSGGRFELGIGWGSVPDELARFDLHDERPAVRSARLAETLEVLELLFTGEPFDYAGRFHTLTGAQQRPVPLHGRVPVVIGGSGPTLTMPLVARHADWWNCPSYDVARLEELLPLAGRARISTQHPIGLAPTTAARADIAASAEKRFGVWGGLIVGTPDEVIRALVDEVKLGVEQFFLPFTDFATPETLALFGREVIPAVREAAAALHR